MSATVHLVLGPPGADRAGRLLAKYRAAAAEFGSALLLVPTRRHADRFRVELGTQLAPPVFELQAFADELVRLHEPTLRPHGDGDRLQLLHSVLAEVRAGDLPYFAGVADTRGFAAAAAGYVAELKGAGVDLRQLLKTYPGRESANGTRHHQALRVFDRYHRRLSQQLRFDAPDRVGRAAALWAAGNRGPFGRVRALFVAGFTSFTRYERQLLDAVRESAEVFWIELPECEDAGSSGPEELREWLGGGAEPGLFPVPVTTEMVDPGPTAPVHLIEAPGEHGEARLVARRVREALAGGARPDRVLVVARTFTPRAVELFREVFDEYGIPHDAEGAEPLGRAPAVAFLLRAVRLPDEDWEFPAVAAVLRSAYFRPDWPELRGDPELPLAAESLLRMLGEARGRGAYLKAVAAWEQSPPEPLEDEQPGEPLRRRKQRLAARCRPFLERFFRAWEGLHGPARPEAAVARLRAFADDLGLSRTPPDDAADLARLWSQLDRWAGLEASSRKAVRPERFARVLGAAASAPGRSRAPRGCGVPLLSAERAAGLDCDHLFLVNLGEGSWPDLGAPASLLDDAERDRLRRAGLDLPDPSARPGRERLLFDTLAAAPRRELVLSYAAVDDRGQKLLPCSFLSELLARRTPGGKTVRRMPLDGTFDQEPLSGAELRVQTARRLERAGPRGTVAGARPDDDLADNVARARAAARARFRTNEFTPFDGRLRHPAVTRALAARFGPDKVFSPTALENYVACPFRFLLQHVLRLEPLEDPSEEVEYSRRGTAFHRALARFHRRLAGSAPDGRAEIPEGVPEELVGQVVSAVGEYAAQAPSRATAELWKLEGERLARAARRYHDHWREFRRPWRAVNAVPAPHRLEAAFGVPGGAGPLVIVVGEVEVRVGGYIDRVDLVELEAAAGFWVIDYKTGRAANYQPAQVARFEKLQLPLYALAVERVLLGEKKARPLGLAYWLVTDTGPKPVLPAKRTPQAWLSDAEAWPRFRAQLEEWVARIAAHIRAGDFPLAPRSQTCTDTCPFGCVCRIAQSRNTGKIFPLELPVVQ
jgi:ATP-dependent helicase/nuclease subunit B